MMWKLLLVCSLIFAVGGIGLYLMASIHLSSYDSELYADVGNAAMLMACFTGIFSLHLRQDARGRAVEGSE